jgi:hypothetical protein
VGSTELECGRIEIEAPESTKKFRLLLESFRKIRFFVGKVNIAVTNSGTATERGAAGWNRTGGGGELWAGRRPISFPGRSSPSRTYGPCCRSGRGRSTDHCCGRPWLPRGWASGGGGTGRVICGRSGKETAGSGRPRRKRPPRGSGTSTAHCNAGSSPPWCRRPAC